MRKEKFVVLFMAMSLFLGACMSSAEPVADEEPIISPSTTVVLTKTAVSSPIPPSAQITPSQVNCPDPIINDMVGMLVEDGNNSTYTNPVLGVELTSPHKLCVHEPDYLFDSYGFVLSNPDIHESTFLSVDWLYQATPEQLDTYVKQMIDGVPELDVFHETIMVNGVEGVALWPLPGMEATTHIYLVANNRLYHLIFWSVPLDEQAQIMLDNLSFIKPTQALDTLSLPEARP